MASDPKYIPVVCKIIGFMEVFGVHSQGKSRQVQPLNSCYSISEQGAYRTRQHQPLPWLLSRSFQPLQVSTSIVILQQFLGLRIPRGPWVFQIKLAHLYGICGLLSSLATQR